MPSSSSGRASTSSRTPRYENVDDISYSHSKKLSIPSIIGHSSSDARDEERVGRNAGKWSTFMYDAIYFIHARYSVAVALGADVEASVSDPERLAGILLTGNEMDMYKAWKRDPKRALPPVSDWRAIREPLTASTSAQFARWDDNTDALRALYERSNISRESCKGWMEKYKKAVPLLIAMKKVQQTKRDAEAAKRGGSSYKRYIHEIIACRKIMSEIGKYRIESNAITKELHKYVQAKEEELTSKLSKLERDRPRGAQDAKDIFIDRENYWKRLIKLRVERAEKGGRSTKQNMEMLALERSLKDRITALESRLRSDRSDRRRDRG